MLAKDAHHLKYSEDFQQVAQGIRGASDPYGITLEEAKRVLSRYSTSQLYTFRKELQILVRSLARWDQWAIGALLNGHLGPRFASDYLIWIVLQGQEFYDSVIQHPIHAIDRAPADDPCSNFAFDCVSFVPHQIISVRTGEEHPGSDVIEIDTLSGRAWQWKELSVMHPQLWDKYFLRRDRRLRNAPRGNLSNSDFVAQIVTPVDSWVDFYADPEYLLAQYETLNRDQVCLHASWWCHLECQNGGMDQFFRNSTGAVAREALEGFKRFGAEAHYEDLYRIMDAFPGSEPSRERVSRRAQMKERWPDRKVDDDFAGGYLPDLEPILAQYIRNHLESYCRADLDPPYPPRNLSGR